MDAIINSTWPAVSAPDPKTGKTFDPDIIVANPPSFGHVHVAEKLGVPLHMVFTMPWTPTKVSQHVVHTSVKQSHVWLRRWGLPLCLELTMPWTVAEVVACIVLQEKPMPNYGLNVLTPEPTLSHTFPCIPQSFPQPFARTDINMDHDANPNGAIRQVCSSRV